MAENSDIEILPGFNWRSDEPPILNFDESQTFYHFQLGLLKVFAYLSCLQHSPMAMTANVMTTLLIAPACIHPLLRPYLFWLVALWIGVAVFHVAGNQRVMVLSSIIYFLHGFLLDRRFQFIVDLHLLHQLVHVAHRERLVAAVCVLFCACGRIWETYVFCYVYFLCCYVGAGGERTPLQVGYFRMSMVYWVSHLVAFKLLGRDIMSGLTTMLLAKRGLHSQPQVDAAAAAEADL